MKLSLVFVLWDLKLRCLLSISAGGSRRQVVIAEKMRLFLLKENDKGREELHKQSEAKKQAEIQNAFYDRHAGAAGAAPEVCLQQFFYCSCSSCRWKWFEGSYRKRNIQWSCFWYWIWFWLCFDMCLNQVWPDDGNKAIEIEECLKIITTWITACYSCRSTSCPWKAVPVTTWLFEHSEDKSFLQ